MYIFQYSNDRCFWFLLFMFFYLTIIRHSFADNLSFIQKSYLIISITMFGTNFKHCVYQAWILINSNMRQQNWILNALKYFGRLLVGYTGISRLDLHWKYGIYTWRPTHLYICKDLNCFSPITDRMQKKINDWIPSFRSTMLQFCI